MVYDVFVSYSRKDSEIVDRIEEELRKNGISCFVDRSNIELGEDFAEVIAKSIFESEIILFVWSESSNQSENTANEIALAIDFEKTIVSFKIGTFKSDYKLAYRLVRFNRIDAVDFNEAHILDLVAKLTKRIGKKDTQEAQTKRIEPIKTSAPIEKVTDNPIYESSYQMGKQALINFDHISAFTDLLEPALHDYKDARAHFAQIVNYRTRIWSIPKEKFSYVKEVADEGNSYAQYIIARYYGIKENKNSKQYEYAKLSAEQNDSYGLFDLSRCHDLGLGTTKDRQKFMSLLKGAVDQKNPPALMYLIKSTMYGWTGKKNPMRALELLKLAVSMEIPECFVMMGDIYWEGDYEEKDDEKAVDYYKKAISLGYIEAYQNWANLYMYNPFTYQEKDARKGFQYLMKGAEYNEPGCLSSIGLCYYNGSAVNQDKKNALKWYKKAANAGDSFSFYMIGRMYYYGDGVDTDEKLAWEWFVKGAELVNSLSLNMLGVMCLDGYGQEGKEKKDCLPYFEESAYLGGDSGERSLLTMYDLFRTRELEDYEILKDNTSAFLDYDWVEKNDKKALTYLARAAEQENSDAMFKYGVLLTDIEQPYSDEIKGYKYLKAALQKQNYKAALQLGYLYEKGICVPIDEEKAKEFFKQAVDHEVGAIADCAYGKILKSEKKEEAIIYLRRAADAQFEKAYEPFYSLLMDNLNYDNLETDPKSIEILKWIEKTVETGLLQAILDMGVCYQLGIGRKVDTEEALEWYRKAAMKKDKTAAYNIAEIYCTGENNIEKDLFKAYYWYSKACQYGNEDAKEKLKEVEKQRKEYISNFEQSPDMSRLNEYINWVYKQEDAQLGISVLDEFYKPCRKAVGKFSMQDIIEKEFVECKNLPKNLQTLYRAWGDIQSSMQTLSLGEIPTHTKEEFFPFCPPILIAKMREELAQLWILLKKKYLVRLENVYLSSDDDILNVAVVTTDDDNLKSLLITIVEANIELEGATLSNEKVIQLADATKDELLQCADIFYTGSDDFVRSYAIAKELYVRVAGEAIAQERLKLMDEKLCLIVES